MQVDMYVDLSRAWLSDCPAEMRYRPRLEQTIRQAFVNCLDESRYPRCVLPTREPTSKPRPGGGRDVVVFVVGGVTLHEARIVRELNDEAARCETGWKITIGGDYVTCGPRYLHGAGDGMVS
jgi:hypothetical protein